LTEPQRRTQLEEDVYVDRVEKHHVQCKGCGKWIGLNRQRTYTFHNWGIHKGICPQITGRQLKRVAAVKNIQTVSHTPERGHTILTKYLGHWIIVNIFFLQAKEYYKSCKRRATASSSFE
jgi:hypothetical protein